MSNLILLFISILALCVILVIIYFINNNFKNVVNIEENKTTIDNFKIIKNDNDNIKMVIFVATWCGACNSYKKNIHNNLSKELEGIYKNIKFEFIVDNPENEDIKNLQKYFEIKYFPTIILYKNENFKILPMNEPIIADNIVNLISKIN